jgi:hypothetical protein
MGARDPFLQMGNEVPVVLNGRQAFTHWYVFRYCPDTGAYLHDVVSRLNSCPFDKQGQLDRVAEKVLVKLGISLNTSLVVDGHGAP